MPPLDSSPSIGQSVVTSVFGTLASVNLKAQVEFYQAFLAVDPQPSTPTYAEFHLSGLRLAIFTPKQSNITEFAAASSGAMSLCLEVKDLNGAIAQLTALGHEPPGEVMHTSHGDEIYAYDPDGNRLILHQS
ncbi:MAG: VOC family protein [Cyanobacteria bacterium P01_D01_bin.1]